MSHAPRPHRILSVGPRPFSLPADSPWGPFEVRHVDGLDAAAAALRSPGADALVIDATVGDGFDAVLHWPALSQAVMTSAVVLLGAECTPAQADALMAAGVQDILPAAAHAGSPLALARALRLSLARQRHTDAMHKSHATDLSTGLPNHAQLMEHMSHLLALREREPAPMAVVALRLDGLATVREELGAEAVNVLRRKVAVRLRSRLRASDVLASVAPDLLVVLLAWIDQPQDGPRVADKLVEALRQPFSLTGRSAALAVSPGVALYPDAGKTPDALLRQAIGEATGGMALGRPGFANRVERGTAPAANDPAGDEAPPAPLAD